MNRIQFHKKAHIYLATLIAFCLPLARFTPIIIALLFLNWLIEGDFRNKFQLILKNKLALLFIAFYLLHLIGLLYTENIDSGLLDIQIKLSLFIFPIILVSRPFNEQQRTIIFKGLIAGGLLSSTLMLVRALYIYFTSGENDFFYQAFSFLLHPSYLSMYLNTSIVWLLYNLFQNKFTENKKYAFYTISIILFFSFIIFLLSSKMGLITMVLSYISFLLYYIISRKKYMFGLIGLVMIFISIYSIIRLVPEISGRVNRAVSAVTSTTSNQSDIESTAVRMLIWKAGNQVISENLLLGTGTGDAKDALLVEYQKRGMTGALEHRLNAHNEYYQVFVSLGLIGFIFFLAQLLFPLVNAFKKHHFIYILFLLIIVLNFLTESMFETEAGVMFIAFFNSLLCFTYKSTNGFGPIAEGNQQLTTNN